jgi:hypothetical protein
MRSKPKNRLAGLLERARQTDPFLRTLYVFNTFSLVGGTLYGLYYGVFLYKHTFSLSTLALDGLLGGFGVWLGYLLGVMVIRRAGYGRCIRLAFGLWAIIALMTALIAGHIAAWFVPLAVLRALPGGLYAAAADCIMLREIKAERRSGFMQLNLALEFVASIILPSAIGALINYTGGYQWAFVAAAAVYLASFAWHCRLPKPQVTFNLRELKQTLRQPLYMPHALNRTLAAGFNQLNAFALTIIPFLLLKNEFDMGILTSACAVAAAVVALAARRVKTAHSLKLGYGAYTLRTIGSLLFVGMWTVPLMLVWQLIGKLVTPLHDPLQQSLDIHNDSLILGQEAQTRALQINVLNNTLALVGSTVAFGLFIAITRTGTDQQRMMLQGLLLIYATWRFINLAVSAWINKHARDLENYIPLRIRLREQLLLYRQAARARLDKLQLLLNGAE